MCGMDRLLAVGFGIPVKETLQTWTVLETVLSGVGFVVAAALSVAF